MSCPAQDPTTCETGALRTWFDDWAQGRNHPVVIQQGQTSDKKAIFTGTTNQQSMKVLLPVTNSLADLY